MTVYNLPVSTLGVQFEKESALADAKWVIDERGVTIIYYPRTETEIGRDKYNSLNKKSIVSVADSITMKAFPVTYSPLDDDLKKAGLREVVDVLIYTSMQDWIDNDINPEEDIEDIRDSIVLRGRTYSIKDFGFANHFSDTFLNVTFGLVLR